MTVGRSLLTVLRELQRRLRAVVGESGFEAAEVLLISDGSTDQSESIIAQIVEHPGAIDISGGVVHARPRRRPPEQSASDD